MYWKEFMHQCSELGIGSLGIVVIISVFMGAVSTLQTAYQLVSPFIPLSTIAQIVRDTVILEFAPTLVCIVLAGVVGSKIASELGNMRVSEQIDALESLGRSPSSHLLIPRVIAGLLMIPALTVLADVMGIASGWFSMKLVLPITDSDFSYGARIFWRNQDAYFSVIKSFFFAGSITVISCYMGFTTQQGAEGVGRSTTGAVVSSSVMILLLDVILTKLLLNQ